MILEKGKKLDGGRREMRQEAMKPSVYTCPPLPMVAGLCNNLGFRFAGITSM